MSTSALIQVDEDFFFQSHDGNPEDVISTLQLFIAEAQAKKTRNKDMSFFDMIQFLMKKSECYSFADSHCSADYYYEITEDGKIEVENPDEKKVECKLVEGGIEITIDDFNGIKKVFKSWEEYDDTF